LFGKKKKGKYETMTSNTEQSAAMLNYCAPLQVSSALSTVFFPHQKKRY